MKSTVQKILAVLVVVLLVAEIIHASKLNQKDSVTLAEKRPLLIWYTDPDIQEYMQQSAEAAAAQYGVQVETELVSEVDYIENISERSVAETMTGPDLYVLNSSQMEKATLAGLTNQLDDKQMADTYSEKAVHAVTYDGKVMAYPFYVETSVLLYNRYYADEAPATIDAILDYSENYEASEVTAKVENMFEWNVADVIENYMFLGGYTDLGGEDGDDKSQVSMDLDKAVECMMYYQSLNSFFALDADTITSDEIIQNFIDGKTVFAIANASMIGKLDEAIANGEIPEYPTERTVTDENGEEQTEELNFDPFYAAAPLPDLTNDLETGGLSVTNAIAVNPYSVNRDAAAAIARYLTEKNVGSLYEMTSKIPACQSLAEAPTPAWDAVCEAYDKAAEVPKIMELSDMWLHLEATMADIWRGEDAATQIQAFSDLMTERLN